MRKLLLALYLLPLAFNANFAQTSTRKPIDLVTDAKKATLPFEAIDLFRLDAAAKKGPDIEKGIEDYTILEIDFDRLQRLEKSRARTIQLDIPLSFQEDIKLDLVQVDIVSSDFEVIQRSDNQAAKVNAGLHYQGIINGDDRSIVAISIYPDQVMGLISNEQGNIVLGKTAGISRTQHIAYRDLGVFEEETFSCGTEDSGIGYKRKDIDFKYSTDTRDVGDCVRLYLEVDKDIHDDKGGIQGATDYVTGLMNQVIVLYANENLQAVVSQIVVWNVTSPYSSTSSSGMLSDFTANTGSFNGDLGQLLSYQASGGIAYVNGFCRTNTDYRLSFSSIGSTYKIVPTYSWSVMVIAHEFGHLFGSQHTHACVWNGNSTAIDGCAGSTEGSCALPGNPAQGGTIMSYCHLKSVGINFNEGFGLQPGNVIRNRVASASCLNTCGPPTCDDGIQNGDETGVDCGGSDCPDCPSCDDGIQNGDETGVDCGGPSCAPCPCEGVSVSLSIRLDNYPEETSWEIKSGGSVIASGGTYASAQDGSTISTSLCLPEGCYDFIIYDSFGDGICCSYGSGNYELKNNDNNQVLASGGNFNYTETTNFCVNIGAEPTCDDGVQNGQETGVDCGGPDCPACPCDIPSGLTATPSDESASLRWDDANGADNYDIRARAKGSSTWATGSNLGSPVSFTDLTACTEYEFQVRSNCGDSDSQWSPLFSFSTTGCVVPTCDDGIQNGNETGVDCGGPDCPDCPTCDDGIQNGSETGVDCGGPDCSDCPTCDDGIQNGNETGIDCGGPDCPDCPTCDDGIQNGDETDVDCGGPDCPDCPVIPTCDDGIQNGDETGVDCGGSDCPDCPVIPTCDDGIQNGDETGVDCGGPDCPDCPVIPTCDDGIQNGDETGVDCGGSDCPDCPVIPTCDDGIQNGDETGVDCGGPDCPDCPVIPTCDDGIQNGDETGVDCGGPDCPDCPVIPTCDDGIQNGDETGVDCGGSDCPDCPVIPTCDDGIQNGNETGVDCGGSDCAPCGCQGQTVTLTIQLDKFPQETSWEILSDNTVVSSGGTYGHLPDLSVVTETLCLPNGCYDLKFYDSYGDGICCTYGEGYYQLVDNETSATLAAGSNFGSSDTHNFCVGEPEEPNCEDGEQNGDETGIDCGGENCPDCPTEPSCDDGVQNGDETGVDCGGENCPDCPTECTTSLIDFNDFNNQWGIWNDGGSDCRRSSIDAPYAADGAGSPVRLRDNSSTSHMTTEVLDLSIYEEITVAFSYMTRSMDNANEDFWLQISTDGGNTFNLVEEWNKGDEFENNLRYEDEVTISGPFTSSMKLRFYCDASTNSDYVYLDNVSISGCTFGANLTAPSTPQAAETFEESKTALAPQQFTVFPNPVQDILSVRFELPSRMNASLLITDVQGQKIRQVTVKGSEGRIEERIDVQNYPEGIYLIHLLTTKGRVTEKFIIVK